MYSSTSLRLIPARLTSNVMNVHSALCKQSSFVATHLSPFQVTSYSQKWPHSYLCMFAAALKRLMWRRRLRRLHCFRCVYLPADLNRFQLRFLSNKAAPPIFDLSTNNFLSVLLLDCTGHQLLASALAIIQLHYEN